MLELSPFEITPVGQSIVTTRLFPASSENIAEVFRLLDNLRRFPGESISKGGQLHNPEFKTGTSGETGERQQMNFTEIPPELIALCFTYLNGVDLARVSQTCKLFDEMVQSETLWQSRCRREYGLRTLNGWNGTSREVYGLVLNRFGFLPGMWRNCTTFYGGLVTIGFKEDGRIVGEEWYGLRGVRERLRRKELFRVTLSEDKQPQVEWLASYWGPQICKLSPCGSGGASPKTINIEWKEKEETGKTPELLEKEKMVFFEESNSRGTLTDFCMYKWLSHRKHQFSQNFTQLEMPANCDKLPVTLGLYKGMYGGHGTEIVLLTFDEADNKLNARKISGDPNVPAGEISLCIDLSRPMVLTVEQQETLSRLKAVSPDDSVADPEQQSTNQPFRVPREIDVENEVDYPQYCKARYHSLGTVSPKVFRNPTKIDNHFIAFDKDTFGILWIPLYSFSMFSRVQEDLTVS